MRKIVNLNKLKGGTVRPMVFNEDYGTCPFGHKKSGDRGAERDGWHETENGAMGPWRPESGPKKRIGPKYHAPNRIADTIG